MASRMFRKHGFGLLFDREPVVVVSVAFGAVGLALPIVVPPLRRSMGLATNQYDGTGSFYDSRWGTGTDGSRSEPVQRVEKWQQPVVGPKPTAESVTAPVKADAGVVFSDDSQVVSNFFGPP